MPVSQVKTATLLEYRMLIFGGGLYMGRINGISSLTRRFQELADKTLFVFTAGLIEPTEDGYYYFFIYPQLYGKNEKANSFLCVSRRGRRPEIRPLSPVGDAHGHERAGSERSGQRPSVSGNADGFCGCAVYRTSGGKSTRNFAGVAGEKSAPGGNTPAGATGNA